MDNKKKKVKKITKLEKLLQNEMREGEQKKIKWKKWIWNHQWNDNDVEIETRKEKKTLVSMYGFRSLNW